MDTRNRDAEGRYDYENMDLMCVCGHTLGVHSAGNPKDCLFYSFGKHPKTTCQCVKFRRARKQPRPEDLVYCEICSSKHLKEGL